MRTADCKTVCREIEEADIGQPSSSAAMQHLKSCTTCRAFYDDRLKLRALVADLGEVEAPADFDFRLRARLANENAGSSMRSFPRHFSFGLPSIALAALLIVLGASFAWRVWTTPDNSATGIPNVSQNTGVAPDQTEPSRPTSTPQETLTAGVDQNGVLNTPPPIVKRRGTGSRRTPKIAIQEFSSTQATVVKQEALASLEQGSVFPVQTSNQPLRVSLDYESGVSRTISVPALSFGSQRVAGETPSPLKTTNKGVW